MDMDRLLRGNGLETGEALGRRFAAARSVGKTGLEEIEAFACDERLDPWSYELPAAWSDGFCEGLGSELESRGLLNDFETQALQAKHGHGVQRALASAGIVDRQWPRPKWRSLAGEAVKIPGASEYLLSVDLELNDAVADNLSLCRGYGLDERLMSPLRHCVVVAFDHPAFVEKFPRGLRSGAVFFVPKKALFGAESLDAQSRSVARSMLSLLVEGPESTKDELYELARENGLERLREKARTFDPLPGLASLLGVSEEAFEPMWRAGVEARLSGMVDRGSDLAGAVEKIESARDLWEVFDAAREGLLIKHGTIAEGIWRYLVHSWRSLSFVVDCDRGGLIDGALRHGGREALEGNFFAAKYLAKSFLAIEGRGPADLPRAKVAVGKALKAAKKLACDAAGCAGDGIGAPRGAFRFEAINVVERLDALAWSDLMADDGAEIESWLSDAGARCIARCAGGVGKQLGLFAQRGRWREASREEKLAILQKARRGCGANQLLCSPSSLDLAAFGAGNLLREAESAYGFAGLDVAKAGAGLWRVRMAANVDAGASAYMRIAQGELVDNELVFRAVPTDFLHEWMHHFDFASRRRIGADSSMALALDGFAVAVAQDRLAPQEALANAAKAIVLAKRRAGGAAREEGDEERVARELVRCEATAASLGEACAHLLGFKADMANWGARQKCCALLFGEIAGSRESRSGVWMNWCSKALGEWLAPAEGPNKAFSNVALSHGFKAKLDALAGSENELRSLLASPLGSASRLDVKTWLGAAGIYWLSSTEVLARGAESAYELKFRECSARDGAVSLADGFATSQAWAGQVCAGFESVARVAKESVLPWEGYKAKELDLRAKALDKQALQGKHSQRKHAGRR